MNTTVITKSFVLFLFIHLTNISTYGQGFTAPDAYLKLIRLAINGNYDVIKQELRSEKYLATKDIQPYSIDGVNHIVDFMYEYPFNYYDLNSLTNFPKLGVRVEEFETYDEVEVTFQVVSLCKLLFQIHKNLMYHYTSEFTDQFRISTSEENCMAFMHLNDGIVSLKSKNSPDLELVSFGIVQLQNIYAKDFGYLSFGVIYRKWKKTLSNFMSVKISKLGSVYYVPVSVGGENLKYILDTGSSYLTIDKRIEKILLERGVLRDSDYIGVVALELADGRVNNYRKVILPTITVGDIKVNNIEAVIIEDGGLLLGKSVLNKFKGWRIDNLKNELIFE